MLSPKNKFIISTIIMVAVVSTSIYIIFSYRSNAHTPAVEVSTPTSTPLTVTNETFLATTTSRFILQNKKEYSLTVAPKYAMNIASEGLQHPRFMAMSPDRRLFIGDMTNASDTKTGRVLVLDDFNETTGTFSQMHIYAKNLRNPNSVAFYTDKDGMEWLYVALTDSLIRYKYTRGSTEPEGTPQVIATFPTYGQTPAEGGWHLTRTVTFGGDDMYVSVGSSCNSCEEIEEMRATILKMNPDGTNVRIIAKGLRNAVGITFVNGTLYATTNEIDHVGTEKPNDLVRTIKEGTDYGWPYCYEYNKQIYKDVSKTWIKEHNCKDIPLALSELEPHSAPLGIHFFDATFKDPRIQNSFLVATHGSGKPKIGTGYKVQSITEHGKPLTIIDGFLQNGARVGRPVDVLKYDNTSFFVTDDYNGLVYFVKYIPNNI